MRPRRAVPVSRLCNFTRPPQASGTRCTDGNAVPTPEVLKAHCPSVCAELQHCVRVPGFKHVRKLPNHCSCLRARSKRRCRPSQRRLGGLMSDWDLATGRSVYRPNRRSEGCAPPRRQSDSRVSNSVFGSTRRKVCVLWTRRSILNTLSERSGISVTE